MRASEHKERTDYVKLQMYKHRMSPERYHQFENMLHKLETTVNVI